MMSHIVCTYVSNIIVTFDNAAAADIRFLTVPMCAIM